MPAKNISTLLEKLIMEILNHYLNLPGNKTKTISNNPKHETRNTKPVTRTFPKAYLDNIASFIENGVLIRNTLPVKRILLKDIKEIIVEAGC